jgi:hypothetical protein
MNKKVTIWTRFNTKTNEYDHNHIEYGHVKGDSPEPKSKEQINSWKDAVWQKQFGILDGIRFVNNFDN